MFWSKRDKDEKKRFYLLPGQGGRAHRRKQWFILKWSLFAAAIVAVAVAALIYWLNLSQPH